MTKRRTKAAGTRRRRKNFSLGWMRRERERLSASSYQPTYTRPPLSKMPKPKRTAAAPQTRKGAVDPMLDQIARSQTGKGFKSLSPGEKALVESIAARIENPGKRRRGGPPIKSTAKAALHWYDKGTKTAYEWTAGLPSRVAHTLLENPENPMNPHIDPQFVESLRTDVASVRRVRGWIRRAEKQLAEHRAWLKYKGYEDDGVSNKILADLDFWNSALVEAGRKVKHNPMYENPRRTSIGTKDPRTMTAGEVNRELDLLDQLDREFNQEMIQSGRGNERFSDWSAMQDPLSLKGMALWHRRMALRNEIERQAGPGMRRFPEGWRKSRKSNPMSNKDRNRLRKKQNELLKLAARVNYPDHFRIAPVESAPTLQDLKNVIYPNWEAEIDQAIHSIKQQIQGSKNPKGMGENIVLYDGPSQEQANMYLRNAIATGRYVGLKMRGRKGRWLVTADSVREQKNNPETSAEDMFESFHGYPAEQDSIIEEEEHYHEHLATLGDLRSMEIITLTNLKVEIGFESGKGVPMPILASNEDGTQLFIEGGDQEIDLKGLKMDGKKWHKEMMVLGEIETITYDTEKTFDDREPISYYHHFTEDEPGQPLPQLVYDTVNQKLGIVGGKYFIKQPLIGVSPGIEN